MRLPYDPSRSYSLSVYADVAGLTLAAARVAAVRGRIPGAFRPHTNAHWKISGAKLNELVQVMGGTTKTTRKQLKKAERNATAALQASA